MTSTGRGLGRALYFLLLALLGAVALLAFGTIGGLVWTWFNPQVLWDDPLTRHYGNVSIGWPNTAEARNAVCLIGLALCGLLAMVLVPLLGLMRSTGDGSPFTTANVRRLRVVASAFALVAIGGLALPLVMPATAQNILGPFEPRFDPGSLFMALVALVLAEVFREGVGLREESEGTI